MMDLYTGHMIDDEVLEARHNWQAFKQRMTGGRKAQEDAALEVYFSVYAETKDASAARAAYVDACKRFFQNN